MSIYIHYGSDHYDPALFIPIRNGDWKPKPADGTGLWASREGEPVYHNGEYAGSVYEDGRVVYGWREWCEDNDFQLKRLDTFFRFRLKPNAHLLLLSSPEDLISLPKIRHNAPWQPKQPSSIGDKPSLEEIMEALKPNWCFLDFEKLRDEGIDAVELQNSYQFSDSLATWDCDSMVVLNGDVVEPV